MHSLEPHLSSLTFILADEEATAHLGRQLAPALRPGLVVWLQGELGAGKTSLVRALLRALGHRGPVKSPSYALVEIYVISSIYLYHFDFYRFNFPEEFIDAGFGEYFRDDAICLVEWPDKAAAYVPAADLELVLQFTGEGRQLAMLAHSPEGQRCLNDFATRWPVDAG